MDSGNIDSGCGGTQLRAPVVAAALYGGETRPQQHRQARGHTQALAEKSMQPRKPTGQREHQPLERQAAQREAAPNRPIHSWKPRVSPQQLHHHLDCLPPRTWHYHWPAQQNAQSAPSTSKPDTRTLGIAIGGGKGSRVGG